MEFHCRAGNEQHVGLDVTRCHTEFIQVASPKCFPGGASTGVGKLSDEEQMEVFLVNHLIEGKKW